MNITHGLGAMGIMLAIVAVVFLCSWSVHFVMDLLFNKTNLPEIVVCSIALMPTLLVLSFAIGAMIP